MAQLFFSYLLLLTLTGLIFSCQEQAENPPQFVVLDEQQAHALTELCSRPRPPAFSATWTPSNLDIKALEDNWTRLRNLSAAVSWNDDSRVGKKRDYHRQYVGIIVGRRKLIYINAIANEALDLFHQKDRWRTEAHIICDGGSMFWGALFDPTTKEFSELAFNGVA